MCVDDAMDPVYDEAGMCVINAKSISQRISLMTTEEFNYVSEVSSQFLTLLIRLAHCPDANKVKDAAFSMLRLLLERIFDNNSMKNKFVSYKSTQDLAPEEGSSSKNASEAIMSSVLGSLDPIAILTNILNDDDHNNGNATVSKGIHGILSILEGYNPLKLDDFIILEKCKMGEGCACSSLQKILKKPNILNNYSSSLATLVYLLRCLNHNRFNFGGDIESAKASGVNNPDDVIIVPLRGLLLNCINWATRTTSNISDEGADILYSVNNEMSIVSSDGTDVLYSDSNEKWVSSLQEKVNRLRLEERAYISQLYVFLIYSRHRQQTGDCIKQFMYTIFVRFLYSVTEILFCTNENASKEVDGGKFLDYIGAWNAISAMGSTFHTMKAYQSWREENSSVAPILNLFSGRWKKYYNNSETLAKVGTDMAHFICNMANPTRLGNGGRRNGGHTTSGLDSIRSIRQAEKYIPFGFVEQRRDSFLRILPIGIKSHAQRHSNGKNIPCNCFHILSKIEGGEILGSTTKAVDQAAFGKIIIPNGVENGTGKVMGLITAYIDKTILGCDFPDNNENFEKRVNKFANDIIFSKTMIHEESVNHCTTVPESRMWDNPVIPPGNTARCFDTRIYTLFLLWQRPCVEYPNVSALTASQLELMLSRDPKWAQFITRIFFITERASFQLADVIVKNVTDNDGGGLDAIKQMFSSNFKQNADVAQNLINCALDTVYKNWTNIRRNEQQKTGADSDSPNIIDLTGQKAQYTARLYDLLHEIIIENDMNPACVIPNSAFLREHIKGLDELMMKMF